jgi:hypothetical protein
MGGEIIKIAGSKQFAPRLFFFTKKYNSLLKYYSISFIILSSQAIKKQQWIDHYVKPFAGRSTY